MKNWKTWLVVSIILFLAAGAVGFFLWKEKKKNKVEKETSDVLNKPNTGTSGSDNIPNSSGGLVTPSTSVGEIVDPAPMSSARTFGS